MAKSWEGGSHESRLKLDGKKVIVENIGVYDGSIPTSYRKEVIYHFISNDEATKYYNLKQKK
jgi:hypothetical protein